MQLALLIGMTTQECGVTRLVGLLQQLPWPHNTHYLKVAIKRRQVLAIIDRFSCSVPKAPLNMELQLPSRCPSMTQNVVDKPFGIIWGTKIVGFWLYPIGEE